MSFRVPVCNLHVLDFSEDKIFIQMKARLNTHSKSISDQPAITKKDVSYKLSDIDKLYEYMRLDKEQTGLNNEILVDDCKSYKRDNHPLLIFVHNVGKEYVPISVARRPKILDKDIQLKISHEDIEKIKKFVSINVNLIKDFANEKISVANFVKLIIKSKNIQ